jgi:adenylate cyclase
MSAKRKLAAILAADVVGYSKLMADDEAETLRVLNEARATFRKRIESHGGRVIDTAGDSVLAEFPSAVEAVDCAAEIQRELEKRNAQLAEHRRMQFRIGINLGDVIEQDDGTIYGDGVNVAARMQQLAEPGGICLSGTAFDHIEGKLSVAFKFSGEQRVKNIAKPVKAYQALVNALPHKSRIDNGPNRYLVIGTAAIFATLVAISILWKAQPPHSDILDSNAAASLRHFGKPRLAVLPLTNISPNPEDEYFADGMTEELISRLSRVGGLDVIARTSIMQYKGKSIGIAVIGRDLNVNTILEGSIRKSGDKMRITLQLIDVASQVHLWSADYDRQLKDVFATQSEISGRVVDALNVQLAASGNAAVSTPRSRDSETYNLYLKGRYHWSKNTLDGLKKSIAYFEQALARSPNDARSWAGLADAYVWLGWWSFLPPHETFPKAKAAAEKALALDESLAEAHASLGLVQFLFEWDWTGARQSYERAIELSPSYALAHLWYGIYFKAMGNHEKALSRIVRANELDPLFLIANAEIGWAAYYRRDFAEAERACRKTLELDPNFPFALSCLQYALTLQKNPEAVRVAEKLVELNPGDPYMLGQLGWVLGALGQTDRAREILTRLKKTSQTDLVPPTSTYPIYLGLGDPEGTVDYLEKTHRERWGDMVWIKADPQFDAMRSDPRFAALVGRMAFPENP